MEKVQTLAEHLGTVSTMAGRSESLVAPDALAALEGLNGRAFFKAIVRSREYRSMLLRRIELGVLPPAVECRILDHAFGKVPDKLEVKDKTNAFEDWSVEQLEARASFIMSVARQLRRAEADPAGTDSHEVDQSSIH